MDACSVDTTSKCRKISLCKKRISAHVLSSFSPIPCALSCATFSLISSRNRLATIAASTRTPLDGSAVMTLVAEVVAFLESVMSCCCATTFCGTMLESCANSEVREKNFQSPCTENEKDEWSRRTTMVLMTMFFCLFDAARMRVQCLFCWLGKNLVACDVRD